MSAAINKRVCLDDGGALAWTRVMAGEYRCDLPHGSYYIDQVTTSVRKRGWYRDVQCWRLQFHAKHQPPADLGYYPTLTDAKIVANRREQT